MEIGSTDDGFYDETFLRRKRKAEAKLTLAFWKRYATIVESYRRLPDRKDLTEDQIEVWRQTRREEYRRATGVEIDQHEALTAALQQAAESGDRTIAQIVESLRRRNQTNGFASSCTP